MAQQINWTNKLVLEFIELYKNERVLWDRTYPNYRKADEIDAAWNKIRSYRKFNDCCVKELKKKKESLMTTYRLHKYRQRKNSKYRPFWFAYFALESFLGSRYENMKSSNQMDEDSQDFESESDEPSDHETRHQTSKRISPKETPRTTSEKKVDICKPKSSNTQKSVTLTLQSNDKKELKVNKRDSREETDEYDLYGRLLVKKIKKLDEHQRDLAMHEIDDIMYRIKMQSGNQYKLIEQQYSVSSSPYTMKPQLIVVPNSSQFVDQNVTYQDLEVQEQLSS